MTLRILHLDTERTWRGGEAQLLHLALGLAQRGHYCIVAGQPDSPLLSRAAGKGLRTEAVAMPSEWSLPAVWTLSEILKRERIQVIHMHTSHACTLGGWAARLAGVPARIISRRVDFSVRSNPLRKMKYQWGVDRILAISEGVRNVLLADGLDPNRIEVVRSGIDPRPFDPDYPPGEARRELGIPEGSPVIGCVAHFADHKGHRYLIEAAVRVAAAVPDVRFLLVGEGELRPAIELQIKDLGLERHVVLTGFRNDVPRLLAAMDIVVLSSHLEGLGTSLLDAMAMARPVVATRVGGIPEMVEDGLNGRLVPPRDPAALAEALIMLINRPEERKRLGRAGRTRMLQTFSAEAMVAATEAVYRKVLDSKGIKG
ncbi:MAG TPA: glycosyltransferase [Nitrospiria bacterium]|jgi:glycosyltransferase involved in cell wall biosynthesis|nr:glycosyltransferase [Nitrospiria bacterium]